MKYVVALVVVVLAGVGFAAQGMQSNDTQQEKPAAVKKAIKWKGRITVIDKDQSNFTIRGGSSSKAPADHKVFFDNATRWTKSGKPAEQSEFTEGSYVTVYGKPDQKGRFQAIEVDLLPSITR